MSLQQRITALAQAVAVDIKALTTGKLSTTGTAADSSKLGGQLPSFYDKPGLGWGQTWLDVTNSRNSGVTYTNTTGRPIMLGIGVITTGTTQGVDLLVGGTKVDMLYNNNGNPVVGVLKAIVPAGSTYRINVIGAAGFYEFWKELR